MDVVVVVVNLHQSASLSIDQMGNEQMLRSVVVQWPATRIRPGEVPTAHARGIPK